MCKVRNSDLFEINNEIIAPLFENIEYPWQVLPKIKGFLSELKSKNPMGYKEYTPGVFVGKDVKISKTAHIDAPTVICDGCEIRPGAYIRGNVFVGKGCVIGNSSEIKNSVILDFVQIPHYNYVGDSVLGNKSHLGAGTICSNLKADKKNVVIHSDEEIDTGLRKVGAFIGDGADVGCSSVLNPGTVIGKGSNVYPLTSVRGVIPENSIMKDAYTIVQKK